jgi:hypothetical protein
MRMVLPTFLEMDSAVSSRKCKYIPTKDKLFVTYVYIYWKQKTKLRATDLKTVTGYTEKWIRIENPQKILSGSTNFIIVMVYPDSSVSCFGSYTQSENSR